MIYRREDVNQLGFSCLHDEVEGEPLVLTIDRFVEQLDLQTLQARYSEAGAGYYDPGMLLKIWFYAYCDRSWRCREVARRLRYDVRYRYFVGTHRPDFRTLNRFRHDHLDLLTDYFAALVGHCEQLGLIDSSVVALDGTKIRANASGRKRSGQTLRQEISRRLERDVQSDNLDGEVTAVRSSDPEARFMKTGQGAIRLCYNAQVVVDNNQIIVAADVGSDADDKSSLPPLLEQAQRQVSSELGAIVADGGYYSGRNLKYAQERGLDVYIPKGRDEHDVFGQAQFVYDRISDRYRCPNGQWLKRSQQRQRNGVMKTTYRSTVVQCRDCKLKTACTHDRYRALEIAETFIYERQLAAKLASPEGQAIYVRRQSLVEPVFGNLKFNFGFRRFSLRGLARVKGEFLLLCIAHNLKKLAKCRGDRGVLATISISLAMILAHIERWQTHFRTLRVSGRQNPLPNPLT